MTMRDVNGVELHDGDKVQFVNEMNYKYTVVESDNVVLRHSGSEKSKEVGSLWIANGPVVKVTDPVTDARGIEIKVGDTVYNKAQNTTFAVIMLGLVGSGSGMQKHLLVLR